MMALSSLVLSILLVIQQQRTGHAARSLSARRVRGTPHARAADKYDRSITTFSPEGRLLQLEYAMVAAEERGRGLTVCVECEGVVVFAFPSSDCDDDYNDENDEDVTSSQSSPSSSAPLSESTQDATHSIVKDENDGNKKYGGDTPKKITNAYHNPAHNTKIHRLSPTHLLLTSGLAGDSRTLASAFRRQTALWTHLNYGEVVTVRELAKEMGKVRHGIGLRPGARVLGVVGMVIGLDDVDDEDGRIGATNSDDLGVEVRMYRSLPGGTMDRCNVCCTGGGADASGNAARKDAVETLSDAISPGDEEDANHTLSKEESLLKKEQKLQRVIEEVGRVALKYHPDAQSNEESSMDAPRGGRPKKRPTVDIWAVRATPAGAKSHKQQKHAFVNPHRYLGKALMETRYAHRLAVDQVAIAAKCLVHKNAVI